MPEVKIVYSGTYIEGYNEPAKGFIEKGERELIRRNYAGGKYEPPNGCRILQAKIGRKTVGVFVFYNDTGYNGWYIALVYIDPKQRGKGIFKALLAELKAMAAKERVTAIIWEAALNNKRMIAASEKVAQADYIRYTSYV